MAEQKFRTQVTSRHVQPQATFSLLLLLLVILVGVISSFILQSTRVLDLSEIYNFECRDTAQTLVPDCLAIAVLWQQPEAATGLQEKLLPE